MRVVVASLAIGLLPTFLVGALSVPISDDLDVGPATIGAAVSAFFLAAALTSVPAGRQVDRRGAAFGYRTGLTGVGLAAGAIGLLAGAGWHLVIAFAFAGASLAFVDPSIARTIMGSVGWRRQGIAFGVKESAVPSASMLAGITLPLLGTTVGWQVPFLVVSVLAVGLAALVPSNIEVAGGARRSSSRTTLGSSRTARNSSRTTRGSSRATARASTTAEAVEAVRPLDPTGRPREGQQGEATDAPNDTDPERSGGPAHPTGPDGTGDLVGVEVGNEHASGRLGLLAIASGLGGGAGAAVATFIVPTGIVIGMGATAAGLVLSVASLGSIGVRLGAGWLVDRRPHAVFDLLVALLGAGLVGGISLAVAAHLGAVPVEVDALAGAFAVASETTPASTGAVVLLVIGAVLLLGPGWGWTGLVFLTAIRLTPEHPAQASGAILAGLGGGGALFPLGAGWLAESVGFGWTWTVVALALSLSFALMIVVRARQ